MGKPLSKFKCFIDPVKELEFINKINKRGYKLTRIKLGCVYEFEKSEEGKYFTFIHADDPKIKREVLKNARQQGFDVIPHKGDAVNDLFYLTAKEGQASKSFMDESESQKRLVQNRLRSVRLLLAICLVGFFSCFGYLAVVGIDSIASGKFSGSAVLVCVPGALCAVWAGLVIKSVADIGKIKK